MKLTTSLKPLNTKAEKRLNFQHISTHEGLYQSVQCPTAHFLTTNNVFSEYSFKTLYIGVSGTVCEAARGIWENHTFIEVKDVEVTFQFKF